eukprot:scaffold8086_cov780-Prasinococcus_capsulatus_cf.AAC.1
MTSVQCARKCETRPEVSHLSDLDAIRKASPTSGRILRLTSSCVAASFRKNQLGVGRIRDAACLRVPRKAQSRYLVLPHVICGMEILPPTQSLYMPSQRTLLPIVVKFVPCTCTADPGDTTL